MRGIENQLGIRISRPVYSRSVCLFQVAILFCLISRLDGMKQCLFDAHSLVGHCPSKGWDILLR
jgi:hypothetical protein